MPRTTPPTRPDRLRVRLPCVRPHPRRPGRVTNQGRYAGSILEVDFGEEGEEKQVVVVDLTPGARPAVTTQLPLTRRAPTGAPPHAAVRPRRPCRRPRKRVLVEVTIVPEADGTTFDPTAPVVAGGANDDTLLAAVVATLDGVEVISVVDGRNPGAQSIDELDVTESTQSLGEALRGAHGARVSSLNAGGGVADPGRVATLFDECHAAATTAAPVELAELNDLVRLTAEG